MKKYLLVAVLALLVVSAAHAQTTYQLPNNDREDFIDYGSYANLFDSGNGVVINGENFQVSITAHFDPDKNMNTGLSNIQFWNQSQLCQSAYAPPSCVVDIPLTGTISSFSYVLNQVGPVIQGSFSGAYSGTLTLNLLPHHPCKVGRFCYLMYWAQVNSTLTID